MSPLRSLLLLLPALALGCADDDDHLRVRGHAQIERGDGTVTGFDFPGDIRLDDDRVAPRDGRIAGHCTIGPDADADAEPEVLGVGIVRTSEAGADDLGLRSVEIRLDGERSGSMSVTLGTEVYSAAVGASCALSRSYLEADDGLAGVEADCAVTAPSGDTVQAQAELHFAGCDVR